MSLFFVKRVHSCVQRELFLSQSFLSFFVDVLFGRQKRTGRFIWFCLRPTFNIQEVHWKGTTLLKRIIHMVSSDEMFSYGNLFHIVPAMFRSKLQTDFLTNSSTILEDEEESAEDIYDEHERQIKKSHDHHWEKKKEKDQSQCNEWKHNGSVHTEITASLSLPSVESQSESEPQSQPPSQLATNKGHCKGDDNGTNSNSNLFAKLALKPYPNYDVQIEIENAGRTRGIRAPRPVCSMRMVSSSLGSTSGQDPIFYKEVKSSSASASASASVFTSESVPTHKLLPSFFDMCACGSTVAGLESGDAMGAEIDPAHIEYHTVYGSAIHIQRSQKGNSQCILRMGSMNMNMNMFPNVYNFNSNSKLIVHNESFNGPDIGWTQANKERRLLVWYNDTYDHNQSDQRDQRDQNQDEEDISYSQECQIVPPGRVQAFSRSLGATSRQMMKVSYSIVVQSRDGTFIFILYHNQVFNDGDELFFYKMSRYDIVRVFVVDSFIHSDSDSDSDSLTLKRSNVSIQEALERNGL